MGFSGVSFRIPNACLLAALLCLAVAAQQPAPSDEKPEETKTGTITGSVVSDSGQPIAGASIFASAIGTPAQSRATTSDNEGNFHLNGLDPALYMIIARVPAYVASRDPEDSPQQSNYHRVGDSVRLVQTKGAVITGTVSNSSGEPVVKVGVRATMTKDANGQPPKTGFVQFGERETDDRGIYRIYGLGPGTYLVSAGGGSRFGSFMMNAYDNDAPTYAPSSTRDTAAEITVRAGDETTGVDVRYRGEPGRVVSGTANGPTASGAYAYYTISLASKSGGPQTINSAFQPATSRGFLFSGIVDGDYELSAQSSSLGDFTISEPRQIKVRGADVTGIELTTRPLASISGRISLESSKAPECKGKRRPLLAETLISAIPNENSAAWSISSGEQ
jgi:hypothetical protein